jgi:hypothetical protein
MKSYIASIIHRLVEINLQATCIISTTAGTGQCRCICAGVQLVVKVTLNQMRDNNVAKFCTYYGDIYAELLLF